MRSTHENGHERKSSQVHNKQNRDAERRRKKDDKHWNQFTEMYREKSGLADLCRNKNEKRHRMTESAGFKRMPSLKTKPLDSKQSLPLVTEGHQTSGNWTLDRIKVLKS